MQWTTLISALVGAAFGVGATLVTDQVKWKRERRYRAETSRADTYVEYLAVPSRAVAQIKITGYARHMESADREVAVREAFQASGAYEWLYRVGLVATGEVVRASQLTFNKVYQLREVIISSPDRTSAAFIAAQTQYTAAADALQTAMRRELGVVDGGRPN